MDVKEYNVAISLDIEGVFNNVDPDVKVRALSSLNLGENLVNLSSFPTVAATHCQRIVGRGTPRCSVLYPLPWNLAVNSLFRGLESSVSNAIASAGNITIAAT